MSVAWVRTRLAQALADQLGNSTRSEAFREDDIPRGIRALAASEGSDAASAVAEELLRQELDILEWQPTFGASVIGAALEVGGTEASFLEAACTYLSLYFQELDSDIARCRALLDRGDSGSVVEAAILLRRSLDSLER